MDTQALRQTTVTAAESRRLRQEQRVAAWRRTFARYLPFTGWRVPVLVESAVVAFSRRIGLDSVTGRAELLSPASRSTALAIDFNRGIWRSSSLESLEQRRLLALTIGVEEAYVDDSWAGATAGQVLSWRTAAGDEIPLVYGYDAFSTLADGVAAVDEGGTLSIAEGTYSEVLATAGKGLTIQAGGDGAAEVTLDGLFLGGGDTLEFDLPSVADYDRFVLSGGVGQLDFGSATLAVGSVGGLPTDGSEVLGLIAAERGVSVGATGTLYDRTGRALSEESILSASGLDFRFNGVSGDFEGVFLTPFVPQDELAVDALGGSLSLDGSPTFSVNTLPSLVYVYDVWAGATTGQTVTYGSISATYGTDAFSTIGEGLTGVADAGTVQVIAGAGGFYNEQLTITQDVTIQGIEPAAPPATDMGADPDAAVLDGSGLFGAGITVNGPGIDLILENFNLQNWYDGGLLVQAGGSATVTNITLNGDLSGVAAVQRGMRLEAGSLTIDKSIFQAANGYGANNAIQVTGGTFTMTASSVTGSSGVNQAGLAISGGTATISTSYVNNNFYGVLFSNASTGSVTGSDLSNNTVSALRNIATGGVIIDASTNWWGVTAEADVLAKVYSTSGSRVDITPYLLDGTDSGSAAGFQGDYSQLAVTALGAQSGATGRIQEGVNSIANGSLTGINRLLFVNNGSYTGATDVNQTLTFQTANILLAAGFATSANVTIAEVTDGGGSEIAVTGSGNNVAINGTTTFSGNGSLTLSTTEGSIGGTSRLAAGDLLVLAPTGGIALDTNVSTLAALADGGITVSDSGSVSLTSVTSTVGDISVTASGDLTVGTAVEATAGNVTLIGNSLTFTGNTTAGDALTLSATGGDLNIAVATLSFGGDFSATASGQITQTGPLAVAGLTTLSAGNGISLGDANTFAQPVAITSTGAVSLNVAGPVTLAASTITGSLALTAAGAITDSGAVSVSGLTVLDAGSANDITLDAANDFMSTVAITAAGNVSLNDTNGFILGSSTISGNLSVTANGTITDDTSTPIGSGLVLQEQFDYTAGPLNGASGGYGFNAAWVGGTTVASPGLSYETLSTSGNMVLKTGSSSMKRTFDNAGLTSDGSVLWFSVVLGSGDATTEPTQPTNVSFFSDFTGPYAQASGFDFEWDVRSQTSAHFDLRIGGSRKAITTVPGTDYFTETVMIVGKITFSDTANADQLDLWVNPAFGTEPTSPLLSSTGQWTDPEETNSVYVSMYNAPDRTLDEIRLGTSYAAVTPTSSGSGGGAAISVAGTTTLDAGTNAITLDGGNDFVGAVTIVAATNATLNDTNSLDLAASTLSGNLTASAAADLTQSGPLNVGGNATLAAGAAGDITLTDPGNVFGGAVGVTRANDVTIVDSQAFAFAATTVGGNLSVSAGGAITDSAALNVSGTTTLAAGPASDVTLDAANVFGGAVSVTADDVYLNAMGSIDLGPTSASSLMVDAGANITDSGVLTIQGNADFYSYAAADITLDEANDFAASGTGRVQILKAGNVTLNDTAALSIGQIVSSGDLVVTAGGDITDAAALNITGTTLLTTAGDVVLDAANIFGGALSTNGVANVTLNAASNLTLGSVVGSNVASVIAATSAATLTVGTAVGGADITLTGAAIALTGTTTGADVTLNATTGSITGSGLVNGTNLTVDAAQSATLNTSVTTVEATVGNDLTVTAAGGFDVNNLTIGNDLAITAAGAITQTTAVTVPGNTSLTAGSNPITLTLANDFGGPVSVTSASNVSLNDSNALDLVAITASGNLTVTAGGDLTINGTQAITGEADYTAANLAVDAAIGAANVALNATAGAGVVLFDNLSGASSGSTGVTNTQWLAQAFSTTATNFVLDGVSLRLWDQSGSTTGNFEIQVWDAAGASGSPGAQVGSAIYTGLAENLPDASSLLTISGLSVTLGASTDYYLMARGTTLSSGLPFGEGSLSWDGTNGITSNAYDSTTSGASWSGPRSYNVIMSVTTATAGDITGTGLITTAGVTANATGSISLNLAADTLTASAGTGISATDADALVVETVTSTTGLASITSNGTLTVNGSVTSQDVSLTGTTLVLDGTVSATRDLALNATAQGFALDGLTVAGNLSVVAGGAITQTGGIDVTGTTSLSAAGYDITLGDDTNVFGGAVSLTGDDVALNTSGGLDLGTSNVTGNLAVTSNGAITDSGAILVAGTTTLAAGSGNDITLDDANNFVGSVSIAADDVYLNVTNSIELGTINANSLWVDAGTSITDSGVLTIQGNADFYSDAAADITLDEANDFAASGTGRVQILKAGNVTLNDTTALRFGQIVAGGNLAVTAGGNISQSAALNITGTTSLTAGTAVGPSDYSLINLTDAANDFVGAVSGSADYIYVTDANGIVLGDFTSASLDVTASGPITDAGTLTLSGGLLLAAGSGNDITLDNANTFSSVSVTSGRDVSLNVARDVYLANSTISGNLSLTAAGDLYQAAGATVSVAATTTLNVGSANITLDALNDFVAPVSITAANDVTLRDQTDLILGASTIAGSLTVTANGSITDSGVLTVAGTTSLTSLGLAVVPYFLATGGGGSFVGPVAASGTGTLGDVGGIRPRSLIPPLSADITLDEANDFQSAVNSSTAGSVVLNDTGAIILGDSTIGGSLTVTANGSITDAGNLAITGTASFSAGAANEITLDAANDFGGAVSIGSGNDVTLNDTGAIDFGASTISGNLAVTANGAITDSGSLSVAGTTMLAAGSGNDITLDAANDFVGEVVVLSGRNVTLNDTNAIDLGSVTAVSTISGNLTITAAGRIDGGNLAITGTTSLAAGSSNRIVVNAAKGPNSFGGAVAIGSGFNVVLAAVGPLDLGSSNVTGFLTVTANGSVTDSGPITTTTTLSIDAGSANDITLDQLNDVASLQIRSGNNVIFNDMSGLVMCGSTVSGNLSLTAQGAISDNGALSVAGSTTVQQYLNGNDITLDDANEFGGPVSIASTSTLPITVRLNDVSSLALGAISFDGDLNVTANGSITGSEAITLSGTTTLDAGAANDISLSNGTNSFGGAITVTAADDVTIASNTAVDLAASTISGNLTVTANGSITDSGALEVAGITTLTAGAITPSQTATWTNGPTAGSVDGVAITPSAGSARTGNFSGAEYSPALAASQSYLDYGVNETLTLTFTAPVTQVDLYLYYWRCPGSAQGPAEYGFATDGTSSVAIQSGLAGASTSGLTLTSAPSGFMNGVLRVTGSFTTLTITPSSVSGTSAQGLALTALAAPVSGPYDVVLDDAANDFGGLFNVTSAANVTVNDIDDLGLGAITAAGDVTATAATFLDVWTSVEAPRVSLTGAELAIVGPITASGTTTITATNGSVTGDGLVTTGSLTATTTAAIDLRTDAGSVALSAGTDVTINDSGSVNLAGITATAGNVSITAADQITIGAAVTAGQNVAFISTGGGIFGNGLVTADQVSADAQGFISLNLAADSLDAVSSGSSVSVTNAGDLTLGTVTANGSEDSVTVVASGNLTVNTSVTATDGVSLTGANLQLDGTVTDPSRVTLTATAGNIAGDGLVSANAVVASATGSVSLNVSANSVTITSGDDLVINADSAIVLPSLSVTGNASITANGSITDSGTLTVSGTTTLAAGAANDITLDNANDFGGAVSITSGNDVTLNDTGAIALGASTVSGNLAVTANGAITQTGAVNVSGTTSLSAGAANDITLPELNSFGGAVSVASGRDVTLRSNGLIDLGASTISGNLAVTAIAGITDSGNISVAGATNLSSGCESLTLGDASVVSLAGPVTLYSNRDITLTVAGDLDIANVTTPAGNLALTASGNISGSGPVTVGGTAAITVASDKVISLTQANDFGGAVSLSGFDASLVDSSGIELGTVGLGGNLTVTANGSITDAGNIGVAGTTTLDATGNAITLDSVGNDFNTINATGGAVTLVDADGLTLGDTTAASLAVTANGAIDQSAGSTINVTGTTTLAAAAGNDITLTEATNDFGTVNGSVLASGALTLRDANSIILGNITAQASTGLNVTANGSITQAAGSAIVVFGSRFDSTGHDITLDGAANDFQSNIETTAVGANVTLVDSNALYPAATTAGNFTATANGVIADYGPINVTGTTTLNSTGHAITLDHPGNNFGTVNTTGTDVTLFDTTGITLGDTNASSLSVTANGTIDQAAGGAITVTGTSTLSALGGNSITLAEPTNDFATVNASVTSSGVITLNDANGIILGNMSAQASTGLNVTANGTITQANGSAIVVFGSRFDSTGHDITLDSATNDFQSNIETTATGANVTLVDSNALYPAATTAGNFTATANGVIADYGPMNITGTTTLNSTGHAITLDHPGNNFGTINTTGTDVTIQDTGLIDLGTSTVSGNLAVTAIAGITASGDITVTGSTNLSSGCESLTVGDASVVSLAGPVTLLSNRDITLTVAGDLDVANATTSTGNLALTASGNITGSGPVTVGGTAAITVDSDKIISLTQANNFTGAVSLSGLDASLVDTSGIDLGTVSLAGDLSVTANGSITDTGSISVAGTTTLNSTGNAITLDSAGNDLNTVNATGGAVTLVDADGLTLGTTTATSLSVTANGAIDQTAGSTVNVSGTTTLSASAGNSITLTEATNDFGSVNGSVSGAGVLTLRDVNSIILGNITAQASPGLNVTANGTISQADGSAIVVFGSRFDSTGHDITLESAANDFQSNIETTAVGANVTLVDSNGLFPAATTAGNFTATANGVIADYGPLNITGTTTLNATGNAITLDFPVNSFGGNVAITSASDATLKAVSGISFGTSSLTGNLTATASGAIALASPISAGGNVTLTSTSAGVTGSGLLTADHLAVTANSGNATLNLAVASLNVAVNGDLVVTEASNLSLGSISSQTGLVDISAGGTLTVVGSVASQLSVELAAAAIVLDGTTYGSNEVTLNATVGSISGSGLVTTNADTNPLTVQAAEAVSLNASTPAIVGTSGGDFTLTNSRALDLVSLSVGGNASLTANGAITDSGTVAVTGTTTLAAGAANDITIDFDADFGGAVSITSGRDVDLSINSPLDLGTSTVSGNLTAWANGSITDSGALTVSGASNFRQLANGNDITLDDANDFQGPVTLAAYGAGADVTVNDVSGIAIEATAGGNLSVTANGPITDAGQLYINGDTTLAAGAGNDITLDADNSFFGAVSITSGKDVSLNSDQPLDLGASTVSGNLTVTANGAITDSGDLAVTGATSLTAGAGNAITLDAGNDFVGAVSVVSGRDVTLNDINTIDLGDMAVAGNLSASGASGITDSGNVSVSGSAAFLAGCGSITLGDGTTLTLGGPVTLLAGQDATLATNGSIDLAASTVTGNLSVTAANGSVTDSGNLTVAGTSWFATTTSGEVLLDAANNFGGAVSGDVVAAVTLNDTNAIVLGDITTGSFLRVTANGSITSTGNQTVSGQTFLTAGSENDITLDNENDFSGPVVITSGRDVTLNDTNSITLENSTISGNLSATVNGTIKSQGWLDVTGATTLAAGTGNVEMPSVFNGGTVDFGGPVNVLSAAAVFLIDSNSIQLGNVTTTGVLNVQANGSITGSADLDVSGGTVLTAGAANDITLTGANQFAATVTIQSVRDATLNASGGFDLDSSTISGNLAITATGDITDTGASTVAGTTTLDAGFANVTLDAANNFGGAVSVPNANDVTLNDADAIVLGSSTVAGNLAITAAGAITDEGPIAVVGTTSLTAGGNAITLDAANDFGGAVSVASGSDVTLNDTGTIDLGDQAVSGNLSVTGALGITQSGTVTVTGSAAFAAGCGSITLGDGTTLSLGGPASLVAGQDAAILVDEPLQLGASTVGGNLSVTANGVITQSGAVSVIGTTTLAAGVSNDITLANPGNAFGGAVSIASGLDVEIGDLGTDLVLGASTVSGNLTATGGAGITGTGTVAALGLSLNSSSAGITLDITAAEVTALAAGDISLSQVGNQSVFFDTITSTTGNVTLATDASIAGEGMTLGTIEADGGNGSVTVSGGVDVLLTSNSTYTQSTITASAVDLSAATLLGSIASGYAPPYGQTYDIVLTAGTVTPFSNAATEIVFGNVRFTVAYGGTVTLTADRPTEVYVDDLWAGSTPGQIVTSGDVSGTFGYDAFATITTSLPGVAVGGTVNVITGLYNEAVTVSQNVTILGIQPDVDAGSMGAVAGSAVLDGTGLFTPGITVSGSGVTATISNLGFIEWLNGAVLVQSNATATVTNVTVTADLAGFAANYGLRLSGGSLTVDKSIVQAGASAGANNGIQVTGGTFTLTESSVTGSNSTGQIGILVSGGSASVSNSFVTDNFAGMSFSGAATGTVTGTDLSNNTAYAIRNGTTSSTINASGNWWGVTAEADVLAEAVTATGASRIDISPYLLSGTDGEPSTAGFQGDFSQLAVTALGAQDGAGAIQEGVTAIANGSLTGIDRLLVVNAGNYSGATAVNQTLTLQASSISLAGSLAVESATHIAEATNGGGSTITLTGAGNGLTANAAATFTGNGTLSITAANGSMAGAGPIAADTLVLSAPNGSISLGLDVATLTATAGGDVTLTDASGIDLAGLTAGGNVSLTANGAISDSGTVNVTGTTTLAAGAANDITLDGANTFGGAVAITSGGDVTLNDTTEMLLAASTVSGNLSLTSNGTVSQTGGPLSVTGTTNVVAGTYGTPPHYSILLTNVGNDFGGAVSATNSADVQLRDVNAIVLGNITASTLLVTANGSITDDGVLTGIGGLTVAAGSGNDITLDNANSFGGLEITSGRNVTLNSTRSVGFSASTVSGNLALTTNGPISQAGSITVAGSTTLTAGAAYSITLDAANDFGGAVRVTSGNDVTLNDATAIDLGGSTISGNLSVTADGDITDSGNLSIGGSVTLAAGATHDIVLDAANNFGGRQVTQSANFPTTFTAFDGTNQTLAFPDGGEVTATIQPFDAGLGELTSATAIWTLTYTYHAAGNTVRITSGRNVTLNATGAVEFGASTISGDLNVTANASISDSGALTVGGATTLAAGAPNSITLDAANDFGGAVSVTSGGNVTLNDTGSLALGSSTVSGNLSATAAGAITQTGAVTVTGTTALTAGSANSITLAAANDFTGAVTVSSVNDLTLNDTSALAIGGATVSGNLTLTANGGITQSAIITVAGTTSLTDPSAGGIVFTTEGNDFVGALSVSSGDIAQIVDANSIELAASTTAGILYAVAYDGAITQTGPITAAGGMFAVATGTGSRITLTDAGNDFGVAILMGSPGDVTVRASTDLIVSVIETDGNVSLTSTGSILAYDSDSDTGISAAGNTTLAAGGSGDISLPGLNEFGGPVAITSGGNVTLGANTAIDFAASTIGGYLDVAAVGGISDSGALSVGGVAAFIAGNDGIILDATNDFTGAVSLETEGDAVINDVSGLVLGGVGGVEVTGNLTVTAGGDVTGAGTVTAASLTLESTAGGIDLNITTSAASAVATGSISLNQTGNQAITFSNVTSSGGNVTLSTDGVTGGQGMTLGTLSAGGAGGTVTLTGGVEAEITNGSSYTQIAIADGQLVLSNATLLITRAEGYYPALGTTFTIFQTADPISGSFNGLAQGETVDASGVVLEADYGTDLTLDTVSTVPVITGVYVNASSWTADFRNYLPVASPGSSGTLGYSIPGGAVAAFNRGTPNQLNTLPWTGINEISISFSEDVTIAENDFALTGVNTASYLVVGFAYGQIDGVWTASWALAGNITADKLLVNVAGTVAAAGGGLQLAGGWTTPTPTTAGSAFPSSGSPGTAFLFRMNALPGDVNSNTIVNTQDYFLDRAALGSVPGSVTPPYSIFNDVNGNAIVNSADVLTVRSLLATSLPNGEPLPAVFPSASAFASLASGGSLTIAEARQLAWAALGNDFTDGTSDDD